MKREPILFIRGSKERAVNSLSKLAIWELLGIEAERRITFKNPSIRVGEGLEKLGAERGKQYFVITWKGGDE